MKGEQSMEDKQPNAKVKENWEAFIKGDVLNFLIGYDLQAVTIEDGAGRKGVIKRNANGDYKVQITSNEIL